MERCQAVCHVRRHPGVGDHQPADMGGGEHAAQPPRLIDASGDHPLGAEIGEGLGDLGRFRGIEPGGEHEDRIGIDRGDEFTEPGDFRLIERIDREAVDEYGMAGSAALDDTGELLGRGRGF